LWRIELVLQNPHRKSWYDTLRESERAAFCETGIEPSLAHAAAYRPDTMAEAIVAIQRVVDHRFGGRGGGGEPYGAANVLYTDAGISRQLYEAIVAQPIFVDDGRLGPVPRGLVRAMFTEMSGGRMVPITALMPVTRTIENVRYLRASGVGARRSRRRGAGTLGLTAISGTSAEHGGIGTLLTGVPGFQNRLDESAERAAILARAEHDLGIGPLNPVALRARVLAGIDAEARATLGAPIPIIFRLERLFMDMYQGRTTHPREWAIVDQPRWKETLRELLREDSLVLVELPCDRLSDFVYRVGGSVERITNPTAFLRRVEAGELPRRALTMSDLAEEEALNEPDDVVIPGGRFFDRQDDSFIPVMTFGGGSTNVFLLIAGPDKVLTRDERDRLRKALAGLHGASAQAASYDQGLGFTEPFDALALTSSKFHKTSNLQTFRCAIHAAQYDSHWR
jgi:hypothetical protein